MKEIYVITCAVETDMEKKITGTAMAESLLLL